MTKPTATPITKQSDVVMATAATAALVISPNFTVCSCRRTIYVGLSTVTEPVESPGRRIRYNSTTAAPASGGASVIDLEIDVAAIAVLVSVCVPWNGSPSASAAGAGAGAAAGLAAAWTSSVEPQRERRARADGPGRRRGPVRLQGQSVNRDAGEGVAPQDAARRRRREALLQSLAQERRGVDIGGTDRHGRFVGRLVGQRRYFEAQAAKQALAAERRVVDHIC